MAAVKKETKQIDLLAERERAKKFHSWLCNRFSARYSGEPLERLLSHADADLKAKLAGLS